jgi:hypothetical protein
MVLGNTRFNCKISAEVTAISLLFGFLLELNILSDKLLYFYKEIQAGLYRHVSRLYECLSWGRWQILLKKNLF